jgi:cytochrome bd-type quinol oxidase subunit 2
MFAGHLGVGLALKKLEPRLNVGFLLLASLVLDVLLGVFVLVGLESVVVPEQYPTLHYLRFVFPFSHSLVSAIGWTALVALATWALWRTDRRTRTKAAAAMGAAMALHWVGDWLEHPAQLPLGPQGGPMLGLGLWNELPVALVLEVLLVVIGAVLYLSATRARGDAGRWILVAIITLLTVLAVAGQASATQSPPETGVALSWIVQAAVVTALALLLDRERHSSGSGRPGVIGSPWTG